MSNQPQEVEQPDIAGGATPVSPGRADTPVPVDIPGTITPMTPGGGVPETTQR